MYNRKSDYSRIFYNTFTQFGSKIISILLSLLTVSLITRYLGTVGYGNFTLIFTYISMFAVLSDIGFNQIVVREFSSEVKKTSATKASILNIKLILILLGVISPILILPLFPYSETLKTAIVIGSIAVAVGNVVSFGTSILQAHLKLDLVAILDLLMKLISAVMIYIFIKNKLDFNYIICAILIGNLIGVIVAYIFTKSDLVFSFKLDIPLAKKLIIQGVPIAITSFLAILYFKVDTLMISIYKSAADVGIYSLAYKLFDNILMLWSLYMSSVFPLLAKYYSNFDQSKFKLLLRNALLMLIGLSLTIIICGYLFTPIIIRILGGSKFYSSIIPFKILLTAVPFLFLNNIFYNIILAFGKTKFLIQPLLISLLFNILINLYAIPTYGYIGASYTTVATEILSSLIYVYIIYTKFKVETKYIL